MEEISHHNHRFQRLEWGILRMIFRIRPDTEMWLQKFFQNEGRIKLTASKGIKINADTMMMDSCHSTFIQIHRTYIKREW